LKHDGVLIRTVGNILVPYDAKKLSEITRTNEDTVIVALELLKNIGLIEIQENGALFLTQLQSLIGSETNAAERMRNARAKAKELGTANNVRGMFAHCSPELDIDIEKDKDNKSGKPDYAQEREEIINYLNEKSGKAYRPNSDKTKKLISARLNEGFTVQDFKTVIDNKVSSWFGNKDMEKFLRPETLFGTKFEGYLNEKSFKQQMQSDSGAGSTTLYI
jgi:uncharacterized phage protein (TIGR02220 family)